MPGHKSCKKLKICFSIVLCWLQIFLFESLVSGFNFSFSFWYEIFWFGFQLWVGGSKKCGKLTAMTFFSLFILVSSFPISESLVSVLGGFQLWVRWAAIKAAGSGKVSREKPQKI